MGRRLHIIAILLMSLSLGWHWVALQSVAWTTMVLERSQHTSLASALASTFDGQHPCSLCQWVREGKAADHADGSTVIPLLSLEATPQAAWTLIPVTPVESVLKRPPTAQWSPRGTTPPLQPPRSV